MSEDEKFDRFISALNEEKLKAQERRGGLISKKLAWVTGLFAIGSIELPLHSESHVELLIKSSGLLFFVPVVSLVFDLYILGENYGIKRMGSFIRQEYSKSLEGKWEAWLPPRRDRYSWYALPFSSVLIFLVCAIILGWSRWSSFPFWLWVIVIAALMWWLYTDADRKLQNLDKNFNKDDVRHNEEHRSSSP